MMIHAGAQTQATNSIHVSDRPYFYNIRVEGVLDDRWAGWFEGFALQQEQEQTVLSGWVTDLPALYGLLARIFDLGLPLVSIERR